MTAVSPTPDSAERAEVTVCVITRQRPDSLRRLLGSLAVVDHPAAMSWVGVVIVDNDDAGSARPVVDEWSGEFPVPIRYEVEPQPGVSAARNCAIHAAESRYVAFIDDDMTPHTDWLAALTSGVLDHDAAIAIGPVPIEFDVEPPPGLRESGALEFPSWKHGELISTMRTGNVILDRKVLPEPPFDARMANSGGEDHLLGQTLENEGVRIVFLDNAIAEEWTPADRLTPAALRTRQKRLGFAFAKVDVTLDRSPFEIAERTRHGVRGLIRVIVGALLAVPVGSQARRWRGHGLMWFGVGQLSALAGRPMRYYGR